MFHLVNSFAELRRQVVRRVIRRAAIMALTLFGASVLLMAIVHITPGSGLGTYGEHIPISEHALTQERERFGYDKPFHMRYLMWMTRVCDVEDGMLQLGESTLSSRSAWAEIRERLPITMLLSAYALVLALIVAIPAGVVMARRAGTRLDRSIFSALLTLWSVPMVVMATLLLAFAARGGQGVAWFPSGGLHRGMGLLDALWLLTLPAVSLAIVACAPLARQVRAAILEQLGQDYVQTALAKGLSQSAVFRRHVVRASLGPMVTVLAMLVPRLIAGSVIVEKIFSIDGMGMLAWRSAANRDLDLVLAIALITAVVHMCSLLLADVLLAIVDPRVRLDAQAVNA